MTLSNYLSFDKQASFSESVILFYSEGKIISTISNLPDDYSSTESFQKRRDKYTYTSSSAVINNYENRLGLTYSSDYPTYKIKREEQENIDFSSRKNTELCIINSSLADLSTLNPDNSYFYFLDEASFHQKSQALLSALGFDSSIVSENDSISIRFGEDGKAVIFD